MKKYFSLVICIFFISVSPCLAAEDYYQFASSTDQQRFDALTGELRCLVCQNQNLAESNASLATDLRGQIYQQIQRGQTDKEIVDYLVARYGDFILYRPPVKGVTLGLWFGPFVILLFALGYLFFYVRKQSRE